MSQSDNDVLNKIIEMLHDNHSTVANIDKKLDLHIQKTEFQLQRIELLDANQNAILQEHHDRSVQLKRDNELREVKLRRELSETNTRVEKLEEPFKWVATLKKALLWLAASGGAIMAIQEIYKRIIQ